MPKIKLPFGKGLYDYMFWWLRCGSKKIIHIIVCTMLPKPPKGMPPTSQQKAHFADAFPNLKTYSITGPSTSVYNCIAWSVGITNQWLWPPSGDMVKDFDAFYASHGWTVSANCNREYMKRKVALYAHNSNPNYCSHASRETHDCGWHESKDGNAERIMHITMELEEGNYGNIIRCYEKADEKANLNLC